jgi:hypothetical protein
MEKRPAGISVIWQMSQLGPGGSESLLMLRAASGMRFSRRRLCRVSLGFLTSGAEGLSTTEVSESTDMSLLGVDSTSMGVRLMDDVGERGSVLSTRARFVAGGVSNESLFAVVLFSKSTKSDDSDCNLLSHDPILQNRTIHTQFRKQLKRLAHLNGEKHTGFMLIYNYGSKVENTPENFLPWTLFKGSVLFYLVRNHAPLPLLLGMDFVT